MVVFCHEKNFLNSESVELKFVFIFSLKRKFKSYYNLSTSYTKLRQLVYDFDFIDIRQATKIVEWNNVPIIDLSHHSNNK